MQITGKFQYLKPYLKTEKEIDGDWFKRRRKNEFVLEFIAIFKNSNENKQ